jgi:hypothetical protein
MLPLHALQAMPSTMTAPAPASPTRGNRPLGVTILSVLDFLGGALMLLLGIGSFAAGSLIQGFTGLPFAALLGAAIGVVFLVFGLVALVMGWGLWQGAGWAWTVSLVLILLGLLGGVLSLIGSPLTGIVMIVVYLFLGWYFAQDGVQRWFNKAGAWPGPQVQAMMNKSSAR